MESWTEIKISVDAKDIDRASDIANVVVPYGIYIEDYTNLEQEVEDIAHILGIGRTSAYLLVKEGHFKIVRIGNAIRISKRSFDEWLESLDL